MKKIGILDRVRLFRKKPKPRKAIIEYQRGDEVELLKTRIAPGQKTIEIEGCEYVLPDPLRCGKLWFFRLTEDTTYGLNGKEISPETLHYLLEGSALQTYFQTLSLSKYQVVMFMAVGIVAWEVLQMVFEMLMTSFQGVQ